MRVSRFAWVLVCSVPAVFASAAVAQVGGVGAGGVGAGGVAISSFAAGSPMDANNSNKQPYTATWSQKSVQTLANGTTITRESTTRFARDSSGRTYTETHNTIPGLGEDGQPREMVNYHVSDPVARTTTMWNSNEKRATVVHMPEPQTIEARPAPQVVTAPQPRVARPQSDVQRPEVQREDLGTKNIAGVNAKGSRITRTIPAGREGNDEPITTTQESWRSTEYGLIMMSVSEDPRNGTNTREVTEFTPGEPDAALFKVPEGYTVHDIPVRSPNQ